jgi:hypothetical protein
MSARAHAERIHTPSVHLRHEAVGSIADIFNQLCVFVFEHGGLPVAVRIEQGLSSLSEAVVFFDTELIVTRVWFDYAFGRVPEWLEEAVKENPMDVYLLTYPDTPWVPDKARSNGSDEIRMELFNRYEREIQATDVPYYIIKHDLKI